jgi:hypothetical protein
MKRIWNNTENRKNPQKRGLVFFANMENSSEDDSTMGKRNARVTHSENKENDDVKNLLKKPLEFSLRHVKKLENISDTLKAKEVSEFRNLVGYFYSLSVDDLESIPSRVLFRIHQSHKLKKLLTPKMRQNVDVLVGHQREKLRNWLEDDTGDGSSLSSGKISKICSLYRHLHKKSVHSDGTIDMVFEKAKEKLIVIGMRFLERFELTDTKDTKQKIDETLKKKDFLNNTEKLILFEIHSLFPTEKQWGHPQNSTIWKEIISSVSHNILGEEKGYKPNYTLIYELLDEFLENENSDDLNDLKGNQMLQEFVQRGKASELLAFARKNPVLLKLHYSALKEIIEKKKFKKFSAQWTQTTQTETDDIREMEKEIQRLKDDLESLKNSAIDELTTENKSNEKVQKYEKLKPQYEAIRGKYKKYNKEAEDTFGQKKNNFTWEETKKEFEKIRGNILSTSDEIKQKRAKIKELHSNFEKELDEEIKNNLKKEIKTLSENLENLENTILKTFLEKYGSPEFQKGEKVKYTNSNGTRDTVEIVKKSEAKNENEWIVKNEKGDEFSVKLKGEGTEKKNIERIDQIDSDKEKTSQNEFFALAQKYKNLEQELQNKDTSSKESRYDEEEEKTINAYESARRELLGSFSFSKKYHEEINSKQEKIDALVNQKYNRLRENEIYQERRDYIQNPTEKAEEIQNDYYSGLQDRIRNHTLHAADIEVLFSADEKGRKEISAEETKFIDFREKFKKVLTTQLENLTFDNPEEKFEDNFSIWINELEAKLGPKTFRKLFKDEKFDIKEEFGSIQSAEALIGGALLHFRNDIIKKIEEKFGKNENSEKLISHWRRLHGRIPDQSELNNLRSDVEYYKKEQEKTNTTIENEKRDYDAILDDFSELNTQMADGRENILFDKAERETLEKTYHLARENFENGATILDPDGERVFVPGKRKINEALLATRDIRENIESNIDRYAKVPEIIKKLAILSPDDEKKSFKEKDLKKEFTKISDSWKYSYLEMKASIIQMKDECLEIFNGSEQEKKFVEHFFDTVCLNLLEEANEAFTVLAQEVKTGNYSSGKNSAFDTYATKLSLLRKFINFRDGFLADFSNELSEHFKSPTKGIQTLKKYKYYEDETPEKKEFEERFEKIRSEFNEHFIEYEKEFRNVKRIVEKDIQKHDDDRFFKKYGFDKTQAAGILSDYSVQNEEFQKLWSRFSDTQFIRNWIDGYQGSSVEEKLKKLEELAQWENVGESAKSASEKTKGFQDFLESYDPKAGGSKYVWKVQPFSLYDIYATIKQAIEANEVNTKRKSDRAVGALGTSFFGTGNYFGKEFARRAEESEDQRLSEFKTQYKDTNGWELEKIIEKTSNPDEVRAIFDLMKEKGFLQWDSPSVWRALMRLQSVVIFNIPEDHQRLSIFQIKEKVKRACGAIWKEEVYRQWDIGLGDDLNKVKEGYAREFSLYESDDKPRIQILSSMLQRWSQGDSTDVDPARYESFLFSAFKNGKMNGQPDSRWYYLVMGLSVINPNTGKSILSREMVNRINDEFLARFPHCEFLTDKLAPKLNGRIVGEGLGEERIWNFSDFQAWREMLGTANGSFDWNGQNKASIRNNTEAFFYEIVNETPDTVQRVQRMGRMNKEPDHDDGVNYQAAWIQDQTKQSLALESTEVDKMSPDFWRSWLSGFDGFMKHQKKLIEQGDQQWGRGNPHWEKQRKKHLKKVGSNLKSSLTASQTLQGNYTGNARTGTMVISDEDEWNKETGYAINAENSKNDINRFMRSMFDAKGEDRKAYELLDMKLAVEYGRGMDNRVKTDKYQRYNPTMIKILDQEYGTQEYFSNTALIEETLNKYVQQGR